jgi:hypothetical protein
MRQREVGRGSQTRSWQLENRDFGVDACELRQR